MTPYYSDDAVTLYHGDCLEVLASLPDCSVDSVVTDPPYGLEFMGREWDKLGAVTEDCSTEDDPFATQRGGSLPFGGGGQRVRYGSSAASMQKWHEAWATECLRVLKPGGHMLAFGGSRTWHRLTCAVEDAGFEIRDSIAWLYGSGFPKSLDVSKAIDKAAGAEREVTGRTVTPFKVDAAASRGTSLEGSVNGDFSKQTDDDGYRYTEHTAPATPDAQRWQGWGTALKPAFEPIVVARKPLAGTVVANVTTHGTGALNVDGCRVEGVPRATGTRNPHAESGVNGIYGSDSRTDRQQHYDENLPAGRWPSNVVLDDTQAAELDKSGDRKPGGRSVSYGGSGYEGGWGPSDTSPDHKKVDSDARVSRFFPVFTNNQQEEPCSQQTTEDSTNVATSAGSQSKLTTGRTPEVGESTTTQSTSNFPTFKYEPKAPTSERPRVYVPGCNCETRGGLSMDGAAPATLPRLSATSVCGECGTPARGESHATVKPLDLMRWLVRLVTPPGGTVLEPFAGSGTTAEACVVEGFRCIAIEREADYLPLIVQRLTKPIQVTLI